MSKSKDCSGFIGLLPYVGCEAAGLIPCERLITHYPTAPSQKNYTKDQYNQDLLDYYERVMQQLLLVGEALFNGGPAKLAREMPWYRLATTNDKPGYTGDLHSQSDEDLPKTKFPTTWPRLSRAILYSMRHYNKIGFWNVSIGSGKNSSNIPGIPGITISNETFYGDVFRAISELIHEPLYDLGQGYVGQGFGHGHVNDIVPTQWTTPFGSDDFTRLVSFLMSAKLENGTNLWQAILKEAGPPPVKPK